MTPTELIATPDKKISRKVHFETWGCQMNIADSEAMLSQLQKNDYQLIQNAEDADLVVLNTCHIREKARHKVMSRLGELREMKRKNPRLHIAVTGCVAQAEGKQIAQNAPYIDLILGPGKIPEFAKAIDSIENAKKTQIHIGFPREHSAEPHVDRTFSKDAITGRKEILRYVNIMGGCNNFCTFCVVPFTRGREVSRQKSEIVAEVKQLLEHGAREVQLLGQNVNSYGHDLFDSGMITELARDRIFIDLLREVAALPSVEYVRFTTSNPHDFSPQLAALFGEEPKLGKYLHLPVQSGSDAILESMKRKVTRHEYLERVDWLRKAVPDMALSTDLIVGFPGEADEDFEMTMSLVEQVRFNFIFAFKYSIRKNTAAARFVDQIPEPIKSQRLARLNQLQDRITRELHDEQIGSVQDLLFVYEKRAEPGFFYGRTPHYRLVRVASSHDIVGRKLPVKIVAATKTTLQGELT